MVLVCFAGEERSWKRSQALRTQLYTTTAAFLASPNLEYLVVKPWETSNRLHLTTTSNNRCRRTRPKRALRKWLRSLPLPPPPPPAARASSATREARLRRAAAATSPLTRNPGTGRMPPSRSPSPWPCRRPRTRRLRR